MKKYIVLTAFLVAAALGLSGCGEQISSASDIASRKTIPVKMADVVQRQFFQSLEVHGTLESETFAMVPAQIGGTVDHFFSDEGRTVTAGDPLCKLDDEKPARNLDASRQNMIVAREALNVSRAQLSKALADFNKAQKDFQRYETLLRDEAISETEFEQMENIMISARAGYAMANAQVELSDAQYKQAKAAFGIATRSYEDTIIKAPIDGVISRSLYEQGEMTEVGKPVFRIDDPSVLELSVFVPENYYSRVIPGQTTIQLEAAGKDLGMHQVSYRSPTVDTTLRTFEMKCRIENPPDSVVAGLLCKATILLDSRTGPGVPETAIIKRADSRVMFSVENGEAREIPVETGYKTDGYIELISDFDASVEQVVVNGQALLNHGSAVRILESEI